MSRTFDLAIVGAADVAGQALLELLKARGFPVGAVHALAIGEAASLSIDAGDDESQLELRDVHAFDFGSVALALFVNDTPDFELVQRAASDGAIVIDASGASVDEPDVPLVVAEVNPQALEGFRERGIVASPARGVVPLALVLKVLLDAAGLERVDVVSLVPVSDRGQAAIQELGHQTADLLNFRQIEPGILAQQLAFNLIPQLGVPGADGATASEAQLLSQLRRVLGEPALPVRVSEVQVPVFFGQAQVLHLTLQRQLSAGDASELLRAVAGIRVIDAPAFPTPLEASGSDPVYVGRIREDSCDSRGLNLWLVADNVRRSAAWNVVRLAELLAGDYL